MDDTVVGKIVVNIFYYIYDQSVSSTTDDILHKRWLPRKQLHAVNSFGEVEGIFEAYLKSEWMREAEAA